MRILHIFDGHQRAWPGEGSSSIVYNIAKYTAAKGCDVTVLERRWVGLNYEEYVEGIKFKRIDLHFCSSVSRSDLPQDMIKQPIGLLRLVLDRAEFAFKALRYLRNNYYDIVFVHFPFAALILVTMSKNLRKKMVYGEMIGAAKQRLRLGTVKDTPLSFRIFSPDLYLMKRVRKVIMENESVKAELISSGEIKPEKVASISVGVDTSEFNPDISTGDIRERYALAGKTVVLFVSAIIHRKGVEFLVKAANIVVHQSGYKDALFLLKGRDPENRYLRVIRRRIKKYELKKNIKIILDYIPYDDVKKLYIASDIYVLPSLEEGSPTSLLEPLACGKVLIGTNIGGIAPIIKDGWNGFLVEPANEEELAEKIKYLIDRPRKREEMGKNSRKLAEEEFDWRIIAEKYLEVYEEIKG